MVAQSAITSPTDSRQLRPVIVQLIHWLTASTIVLLGLLAVWLLMRRLGGQLQQPLGLFALMAVGMILAGLTSLPRIVWRAMGTHPERRSSRAALLWGVSTVVILLWGASLSIPGTGTALLAVFWSILLGVEGAWWWFIWRRIHPSVAPVTSRGPAAPVTTSSSSTTGYEEMEPEEGNGQLPDDVCQQITRSWAEDDKDTVTGLLRARFDAKVRSQSLHVAFCPPMLRRPEVNVFQLSGSRARIKAADVQPYGIRFDLRLTTTSEEPRTVLIHFEACCGKPESAGLGGI